MAFFRERYKRALVGVYFRTSHLQMETGTVIDYTAYLSILLSRLSYCSQQYCIR